MLAKIKELTSFSHAVRSQSLCFRPDNEKELSILLAKRFDKGILARGNGSSYSDCCLNNQGVIIDTSRLNHLLSFDETTGLLVCQGSVRFSDLFLVHEDYIPAVIPGTLEATVAGGLANDVHGKNNPQQGCFGDHVEWFELELGTKSYHCSRNKNVELFFATIAGLGLTGFIKRLAIKMLKAPRFVISQSEKYLAWAPLFERMQKEHNQYDYQVAWLDLVNESPQGILTFAKYFETSNFKIQKQYQMPKLPLRLINRWIMSYFNQIYFKKSSTKECILSLPQFNNPLDSIKDWNRVYGKKGLLQFQAQINRDLSLIALQEFIKIIHSQGATPTLAVLKYFTKAGSGLLSFAQPGFAFAIDFINNEAAKKAITEMNEWTTTRQGRIYLAKDLLLTEQQFKQQYPQHEDFIKILDQYKSPMHSDLSQRLGIKCV